MINLHNIVILLKQSEYHHWCVAFRGTSRGPNLLVFELRGCLTDHSTEDRIPFDLYECQSKCGPIRLSCCQRKTQATKTHPEATFIVANDFNLSNLNVGLAEFLLHVM